MNEQPESQEVYISFNPFVSTISGHLFNLLLLWALSKSVNFSTEAAGFALFFLVPIIIWTIHAFPYLFRKVLIHDQTFLFMEFLKFIYVVTLAIRGTVGIPVTMSVIPAMFCLQSMYASHLEAMKVDQQVWGWFRGLSGGAEWIFRHVKPAPSVRRPTDKKE